MANSPLNILYQDECLLIVNKPPGLPAMGTPAARDSLLRQVQQYRQLADGSPPYVGMIHRLDAPVTGVTTIALTPLAARALTVQFRRGSAEKVYWAFLPISPIPVAGRLEGWQRSDKRHRRVNPATLACTGAQRCQLDYQTLSRSSSGALSSGALVEVRLITGRKHQIRFQFSQQGWPIVGDRKYGSRQPFHQGIALHCRRVRLAHPIHGYPLELQAELPPSWQALGLDNAN